MSPAPSAAHRKLHPLSPRIIAYLRPEFPGALPDAPEKYLTHIISWNLAVLTTDGRAAIGVRRRIDRLPPEEGLMVRSTFEALKQRKRDLFPDDSWRILSMPRTPPRPTERSAANSTPLPWRSCGGTKPGGRLAETSRRRRLFSRTNS